MSVILYKAGTKHVEFGIQCEIVRSDPMQVQDWLATGEYHFHPSDCYPKAEVASTEAVEPKKRKAKAE